MTSTGHRFPPDAGLSTRMTVTMFLLGLLYVVFIGLMFAFGVPLVYIVIFGGGLLFAQYYFSDQIALAAMGAREVTAEEAPTLHGVVDRLCALANMPKPRVAVAESAIPNAFATGRSPNAAVVCATTALLQRLNERELEGVLAHELSHVAHRDMAVMTFASFLGILAGFITRFAMYAGMFGGWGVGGMGGDDDREGGNPALAMLAVLLVSAAVYVISFLLTRALSRYRELAADRSAALITGRPADLASALVKVSDEMGRVPSRDLRSAEHLNALFFAPALPKGLSLASLFATHPSLEQRLDQLARIERELGQAR
jgi:heat shock protein HtpX